MGDIFLKVLDMSITASWLIIAVVILRFCMKKAPRWMVCSLWVLVAVRLIFPFEIESILSLVPRTQTVHSEITNTKINQNIPTGDNGINEPLKDMQNPVSIDNSGQTTTHISTNNHNNTNAIIQQSSTEESHHFQMWPFGVSIIWLAGVIILLAYMGVSYLRTKNKTRVSVVFKDNIRLCDEIQSPFVFGIVKPSIYLPSDLSKEHMSHVLAHEQAHLKRYDHCWKLIGFLLLAVYWFHPLCWLSYILFCRDIEFACDEKVVKSYNLEDKKAYSNALLACGISNKNIIYCPVAFGEVGVKARIKGVLNYKKPSFWIVLVSLVACVVVAVCFLTNPVKKDTKEAVVKESTESTNNTSVNKNSESSEIEEPTEEEIDISEEEYYQNLYRNQVNGIDTATYNELVSLFSFESTPVESWYLRALTSYYSSPQEMDFSYFFYSGCSDYFPTAEEQAYAAEHIDHFSNLFRATPDGMNEVLNTYFGISLSDIGTSFFNNQLYYEPTGNYLLPRGDDVTRPVVVTGASKLGNGKVELYYYDKYCPEYQGNVTLRKEDNVWKVISNLSANGKGHFSDGGRLVIHKSGQVVDVQFDLKYELGVCENYAILTAVDENGDILWEYITFNYAATELDVICSIGIYGNYYYYTEGGTVVALNLRDGTVAWRNEDFNGASVSYTFGEDGILYLCGYYGPDFFAVDQSGNTIAKIEKFAYDLSWAHKIEYFGDYVEVTLGDSYDESTKVLFRVKLSDYSYERVE